MRHTFAHLIDDYIEAGDLETAADFDKLTLTQQRELTQLFVDDANEHQDKDEWLVNGQRTVTDLYFDSDYLSSRDFKTAMDIMFVEYYKPMLKARLDDLIDEANWTAFWEDKRLSNWQKLRLLEQAN